MKLSAIAKLVMAAVAGSFAAVTAGCGSTDPYSGGAGLDAPATSTAAYPAGPYGVRVGSVIADASFYGYGSATDKGLRLVSLHDFYDPDGSKGIKLVYFSAGAIWCPPCNEEALDFATNPGGAADLTARLGVHFFQDLTQGARHDSAFPASEADLQQWLKKHPLPFPVVLDPSHDLEVYFDANGIPFGMLIDPRTMTIVKTTDGWFGDSTTKDRMAAFEAEITPYLAK